MKCHHLMFAAMLLPLIPLAGPIGCISSNTSSTASKADKFAPQQVVFSTQELADSIAVGRIERAFDNAGIMRLNVPLRATTDLGLSIDYRITWLDDNRNPVDTPTAWQTKSLAPDAWQSIQASSATPHAKDFQVDIRWKQ